MTRNLPQAMEDYGADDAGAGRARGSVKRATLPRWFRATTRTVLLTQPLARALPRRAPAQLLHRERDIPARSCVDQADPQRLVIDAASEESRRTAGNPARGRPGSATYTDYAQVAADKSRSVAWRALALLEGLGRSTAKVDWPAPAVGGARRDQLAVTEPGRRVGARNATALEHEPVPHSSSAFLKIEARRGTCSPRGARVTSSA